MLKKVKFPSQSLDDTRGSLVKDSVSLKELNLVFYMSEFQLTCSTEDELKSLVRRDLNELAKLRGLSTDDYFKDLCSRYPYHD